MGGGSRARAERRAGSTADAAATTWRRAETGVRARGGRRGGKLKRKFLERSRLRGALLSQEAFGVRPCLKLSRFACCPEQSLSSCLAPRQLPSGGGNAAEPSQPATQLGPQSISAGRSDYFFLPQRSSLPAHMGHQRQRLRPRKDTPHTRPTRCQITSLWWLGRCRQKSPLAFKCMESFRKRGVLPGCESTPMVAARSSV